MFWSLFVITAITSGIDAGDYKYTHIGTFETREVCEIARAAAYATYVFPENIEVRCLKTDES